MHHKKKGRKIYTYRVKNRRVFSKDHPLRRTVGTVLLLAVMAFLGFVGYHVIGPVLDRISEEKTQPTLTDDPYFTAPSETTVTTAQTTRVTTTTTVTTTTASAASAAETTALGFRLASDATVAYCLSPDSLTDVQVLSSAVSVLSQSGYTALVIPLKTDGGWIRYRTDIPAAKTAGAVVTSTLTLQEITDTVSAMGLSCYAMTDVLGDHLYPAAFPEGAFRTEKDDKLWTDAEKKAWISPYADSARSYLNSLAAEIAQADFMGLLLTDVTFPVFSKNDQKALGTAVTDEKQRRGALTSLVNGIAVAEPNASLTVDLSDALNGKAEALHPEALTVKSVCVRIDYAKFEQPFRYDNQKYDLSGKSFAEQTKTLLQLADAVTGKLDVIPWIVRGSMSDANFEAVLDTAYQHGCKTVFVS